MRYVSAIFLVVLILGGFLLLARSSQTEVRDIIPTATESIARVMTPNPNITYPPGREPITLPANFRDELIHYMTVDRVDEVTRNLYISPQALEAVRNGDSIPENTLIVIEAFNAARNPDGSVQTDDDGWLIPGEPLEEIHVGERRSTWQISDLAASSHLGGWNFAAFDFDTQLPVSSTLNDCFSCHDAADRREFIFSFPQLNRFARTGELEQVYCRLADRQICF